VDGHPATVSFGFGPSGLSRVTVKFLGEGQTLRETYARIEPQLHSEYGEPERTTDAKEAVHRRLLVEGRPLRI